MAGKVAHGEVVSLLAPSLERLAGGRTPRYARSHFSNGNAAKVALVTQETEQTHLAMGFHAFGRRDERRYALRLLSVILGENMSSRLFQKLREQHGFCYSVQSGMVARGPTRGLIGIYAGLDAAKLEKAMRMILRELERFCHAKPSRSELKKAQDYAVGQTLMGLESTTNQAMWMGSLSSAMGKSSIRPRCTTSCSPCDAGRGAGGRMPLSAAGRARSCHRRAGEGRRAGQFVAEMVGF